MSWAAEPPSRSHRPPRQPPRRRGAHLLAALTLGAVAASVWGSGYSTPSATAGSHPQDATATASIPDGVSAEPDPRLQITEAELTARLDELAASRARRAEANRPKAVLPVEGRLTSMYGNRWGTKHYGLDIAAPMRTPEYAAADGVVIRAGAASGFGLAVYIRHANGDVTVYGHMDKILVTEGQAVQAGDTIALLGNRGQSTGPHLHFEVYEGGVNGRRVDPADWLAARGVQV